MISPETLRFYPLFADQDTEMLKQIAMLADLQEVEAGHRLWDEGAAANSLYLIQSGSIVLTINMGEIGDQKLEELEPIGKGEVIGWSSIVKPYEYKMGAYAAEKSQLIAFEGEKLRALFDENPAFGYYFMKNIAEVIGSRYMSKCLQLMSLAP